MATGNTGFWCYRRKLFNHRKFHRAMCSVGGDHGVTINSGVVERWNLFDRHHIGSQHEPFSLLERHGDRGQGRARADHERLGVFERCHTGHGNGRLVG